MQLCEHVAEDYVATGLSLKEHPVHFFREHLTQLGVIRNAEHRSEDLPQDLHLTGREAGEHATKAAVGRLLLTHLVCAWGSEAKTYEAAASAFAGPIEIVRPGARYEI